MICVIKTSLKFVWKTSSFNCFGIFFADADTKNRRYTSAKASVIADCRGEFRMLRWKTYNKGRALVTFGDVLIGGQNGF